MFRGRANEHFARRYGRVLAISLLMSATFFVVVGMVAPPYAPQPYRLRETPTTMVNLAPNFALHKAPPRIPRPPIPDDPIEVPNAPDLPYPDTDFPLDNPPLLGGLDGPEDYIGWTEDPVLVRQVAPEYPDLARQAESAGRVKLLITIDETGRVVDAEILESEVIASMERAAIVAARQWLFKPAYQRDIPVPCRIVISFNFSLR